MDLNPIYASQVAGMTDTYHHTQLLVELANFLPGWPQTVILQISASQIAGITKVSHHIQ
jgi:hypothetical protein